MNNDLISREALKKHKVYSLERHEYVVPVYNIDNAPTVEIGEDGIDIEKYSDRLYKIAYEKGKAEAERPHGEWKDYSDDGFVECPFCGSATTCDGNKDELHFCWNCGAKMMGENTDT